MGACDDDSSRSPRRTGPATGRGAAPRGRLAGSPLAGPAGTAARTGVRWRSAVPAAVRSRARAAVRRAAVRSRPRAATRSRARAAVRSRPRAAVRSRPRAAVGAATRHAVRAATRHAVRPAVRSVTRCALRPAVRSAARPVRAATPGNVPAALRAEPRAVPTPVRAEPCATESWTELASRAGRAAAVRVRVPARRGRLTAALRLPARPQPVVPATRSRPCAHGSVCS